MKKRKILAIDDSRIDISLLKNHLQKMGLTALLVNDAIKGIGLAVSKQPDVILLDVMMPDIDGFEVCKRLKADSRTSAIPVIFVSAKDESCDKIEGLNIGAIDYITKPYDPGELKARIESVIRTLELEDKVLSLANTDELTGLANRRYFLDVLEREISSAKIKGQALSMMMLDIDHFKNVNDTYGHAAGDEILRQTAKILKENLYPLDIPARYGGDEFAILMPETLHFNLVPAAEKLRKKFDQWEWNVDGKLISTTVSIGLACTDCCDFHELIKIADKALYKAKEQGRNRFVCWGQQVDDNEEAGQLQSDEYEELQTKISSLAENLRSQFLETISAFVKTIAIKDPYIARHARSVQVYASAIAEEINVSEELKERLESAALLHDLGKVGIPDGILRKSDPLSEHDRQIIEQHPQAGVDILKPIGIFNQELPIIRQHHERFNGNGYPDGLKGREITFGARILAVADVFDAITSERPYRAIMPFKEAQREILDRSGSQFDPEIIEAFKIACEKYKEEWPLSGSETSDCFNREFLAIKM